MQSDNLTPFGVGWNSWLTLGATPDGVMGIPRMAPPHGVWEDCVFVPFSRCGRFADTDEAERMVVCFYEDDEVFADVIAHPDRYVELLSNFRAVVSPDCSLYRNAPLAMQVWNLYVSRLVGAYWQRQGLEVIPQVRWGSEETFTAAPNNYFKERVAFLGVEPGSTVAVSTYGCFRAAGGQGDFRRGIRRDDRRS